jgi:RIO kinase 1|eukprot:COSAG02_NODE_6951_length_3266_cov_33.431955_3_plen_60_part_00
MLRNHVLLMEFIGKNGVAAPRLKDAEIDVDAAHVAYLECTRLMCEFAATLSESVDVPLT